MQEGAQIESLTTIVSEQGETIRAQAVMLAQQAKRIPKLEERVARDCALTDETCSTPSWRPWTPGPAIARPLRSYTRLSPAVNQPRYPLNTYLRTTLDEPRAAPASR